MWPKLLKSLLRQPNGKNRYFIKSLIDFSAIWWMIVATSAVFVGLLLFESFPLKLIVTGLFSNLVYLGKVLA